MAKYFGQNRLKVYVRPALASDGKQIIRAEGGEVMHMCITRHT